MSALVQEAERIANQFDYPPNEVQRGVKEYIREVDEGLSQEGTTLSQIPTFVTSVPNGTEKVREPVHEHDQDGSDISYNRACTWPST